MNSIRYMISNSLNSFGNQIDSGIFKYAIRATRPKKYKLSVDTHPQIVIPMKYLKQCGNFDECEGIISETNRNELSMIIRENCTLIEKTIWMDVGLYIVFNAKEFTKLVLHDFMTMPLKVLMQNSNLFNYKDQCEKILKLNRNENVLIEYSSPNIAKPFHAGHLRSTVLGNCIGNIYEYLNNKVTRINYFGDWGTQFGILLLGIKRYNFDIHSSVNISSDLYDIYVKINQDIKNDETLRKSALEYASKLEQGSEPELKLWKEIRDKSLKQFKKVYDQLNIKFDSYEGESDYVDDCKKLITDLMSKQLLKKSENSNVLYMDLSKEPGKKFFGNIAKSDGSTLYLTRDIAALINRKSKYNFDKIHYVVENGQHNHFAQLHSCIHQLNFDWFNNINTKNLHVKFGRVEGMSTRKGTAIFLEDIIYEATSKMKNVLSNTKTTKINVSDFDSVAEQLAISAITFQDLGQLRSRHYKFEWDKVLQFHGYTGVYIQYTYARLCSLERKFNNISYNFNLTDVEHLNSLNVLVERLLICFCCFEKALYDSYIFLEPHYIASYVHSLCKIVNSAYDQLSVIDADNEMEKKFRLLMFCQAKKVIKDCLNLIGLKEIETM